MSRRVSMPGADELFRRGDDVITSAPAASLAPLSEVPRPAPDEVKATTGRVRHDEKITVYMSGDELFDLEHMRLALRRQHGVAVDRGRIVREALQLALDDVADLGDRSPLVRRLAGHE